MDKQMVIPDLQARVFQLEIDVTVLGILIKEKGEEDGRENTSGVI